MPRLDLEAGPWAPGDGRPGHVTGVVVLEGLLVRDVRLGRRVSTELLTPGDVVDPWRPPDELLPSEVSWSAQVPTTLAVLDARFARAARHWPSLSAVVQQRLGERADRLASQAALLQLPTVEERVLAVMWQLAERLGRVRAGEVVLPLPLTHRLIGQLTGARRPTVTLALRALRDDGHVVRDDGGSWLLAAGSRELLAPAAAD